MGKILINEQHCTLVLSAAQAYDAQHAMKTNSCGTRCSVYNSTIHKYAPTEYAIDNCSNLYISISQLNINNGNNDYSPNIDINNVNTE